MKPKKRTVLIVDAFDGGIAQLDLRIFFDGCVVGHAPGDAAVGSVGGVGGGVGIAAELVDLGLHALGALVILAGDGFGGGLDDKEALAGAEADAVGGKEAEKGARLELALVEEGAVRAAEIVQERRA